WPGDASDAFLARRDSVPLLPDSFCWLRIIAYDKEDRTPQTEISSRRGTEGIGEPPQQEKDSRHPSRRRPGKRRIHGHRFHCSKQCTPRALYSSLHKDPNRTRCEEAWLSPQAGFSFPRRETKPHRRRDGLRYN